jgi:type IV secretion system protein VirD4
MMLDEMTAPGRIPIIAESISYLPGYNVRVVMIIHTPAQLREVYGIYNSETMLKSLAARIVFAPKDYNDAKEISDELGFTTVKVKTVSKGAANPFESKGGRPRSQNVSEQRRALLLPQEVKELGSEDAIIFYEGLRPIRCQKIRYYADRRFRARLMRPPTKPAQNWRPAPTRLVLSPATGSVATAAPDADPTDNPVAEPTSSPSRRARSGQTMGRGPGRLREATIADIERIGSLTLDDYETNFSKVSIPDRAGRLTDKELTTAAQHAIDLLGP